jgi:hypothetical protein
MIKIIKIIYLGIIMYLLLLVVTLPLLIVTFNVEQSFNITDNMLEEFFDYLDL